MALDTRNKRASVLGVTLVALVILPAPDASMAQADRQQVAVCYAGISAGVLVAYDYIEFTNVTLTFATLTDVTLEPD